MRLKQSRQFAGLWLLFFILFLAGFYSTGMAPRGAVELGERIIAAFGQSSNSGPLTAGAVMPAMPRIIIPDISASSAIVFLESTDLDVLNNALTKGVVHYPHSALPGENGNVFLFGHSTGLKVVNNQNYAVFNRLSELEKGDIIRLRYGGREYWYRALSVKIKKAEEALVDLDPDTTKRLLTLSTCRIFGAKEDRFVVEAEFVKSYPLRSLLSAASTSS